MFNSRLTTFRNRFAPFTRTIRRQFPLLAAFASISFIGLERLGGRVSGSRTGRLFLVVLAVVMLFAGPAAAQAGGGSGPLQFLCLIHQLVTQSAGTIIITMVIVAGVLKMIPMRGTNNWGNVLIGSVLVGIVFLVVGPAFVDLADQSSSAVSMSSQCGGGG